MIRHAHVPQSSAPLRTYFPAVEWEGVWIALLLAVVWLVEALATTNGQTAKSFMRLETHAPLWVWSLSALFIAAILAKGIRTQDRLLRALGNAMLVGLIGFLGYIVLEASDGQLRTPLAIYAGIVAMRCWVVKDNFLHYQVANPQPYPTRVPRSRTKKPRRGHAHEPNPMLAVASSGNDRGFALSMDGAEIEKRVQIRGDYVAPGVIPLPFGS